MTEKTHCNEKTGSSFFWHYSRGRRTRFSMLLQSAIVGTVIASIGGSKDRLDRYPCAIRKIEMETVNEPEPRN